MRYNGGKCVTDTNGTGETCPGAPRSVYSGIPWGTVDIDGAYTRPLFTDISTSPYIRWKVASGSINIRDLQIPSLPIAILYTQIGNQLPIISSTENNPTKVLNPYVGPPHSYPTASLSQVLQMTRVELINRYSGKYIFIGESGTLIHDSIVSPVTGTQMDGVETHAQFLD